MHSNVKIILFDLFTIFFLQTSSDIRKEINLNLFKTISPSLSLDVYFRIEINAQLMEKNKEINQFLSKTSIKIYKNSNNSSQNVKINFEPNLTLHFLIQSFSFLLFQKISQKTSFFL